MKKILIIGVFIMGLMFVGCTNKADKEKPKKVETRRLMELDEYKNISLDKIESIKFTKYTEGGDIPELITDKDRITTIYNNLSQLVIGEETNRACEDNTEVYQFNLTDGTTSMIEIECDWVIINNKRYLIK